MADVELVLKADNRQYIKAVDEAQKSTQNLNKTVIEGKKTTMGLIEREIQMQKQLQERANKSPTIDKLRQTNQLLDDSRKRYDKLKTAGIEANTTIEKSGNNLLKSVGRWALGFVSITTVIQGFKKIMMSTETTTDQFKIAIAGAETGLKYFFKAIASGNLDNFSQGLKNAVTAGKEYAEALSAILHIENQLGIVQSDREIEIQKLREEAHQQDKFSATERKTKLLELIKLEKENFTENKDLNLKRLNATIGIATKVNGLTEDEIKLYLSAYTSQEALITLGKQYLGLQREMVEAFANKNKRVADSYLDEMDALGETGKMAGDYVRRIGVLSDEEQSLIINSWKVYNIGQAQFKMATRLFERQLTEVNLEIEKDRADILKKIIDDRLKKEEQYYDLSLKLLEDYEAKEIDKLQGGERLIAQAKFAQKALLKIKAEILKVGELTPEQQEMFNQMAVDIDKNLAKALSELTPGELGASTDMIDKWKEGFMERMAKTVSTLKPMTGGKVPIKSTFWDLFGIAPETDEGQKQIEGIKKVATQIGELTQQIIDKSLDVAQRRRELLDIQIAETQRSLEIETQLMEDGFANNVDAKRKEVEALKLLREQALKDEEKAQKAQLALQSVMQTVNMITATTEIWKTYAKNPILAIALTALMWGAFVAAKAKAFEVTKLEEGGSGTVTGKRHSNGGERFLDHVEVEQGERWGVLSRKASDRFGNTFDDVVSSFNKGEMPNILTPVSNSVFVNNDGSNSRLDRVITEQKILNNKLGKNMNIMVMGGRRIITTGNKIRIIG